MDSVHRPLTKTEVEEFLICAAGQRVLVIGDVMIDQYLRGTTDRQSPEAPVPILELQQRERKLGGAANVALNLIKLIDHVDLVGIVGTDEAGTNLEDMVVGAKINPHLLRIEGRRTTVKTRLLSNSEHLLRVDDEVKTPLTSAQSEELLKIALDAIDACSPTSVVLQDYNKGVLSPFVIAGVLQKCREANIPVAVDPKFENVTAYQHVDLFKPNFVELQRLVPFAIVKSKSDLDRAAEHVQSVLNVGSILVTLSEDGAYFSNGLGESMLRPTWPIQVIDVCGAGDSVIAVASLASTLGYSAEKIVELTNLAGGIICTLSGVHPLSKKLLMDAVAKQSIVNEPGKDH